MLPTTAAFKTAIDSNIRQISARARVNFSDVLLDLTAAPVLESTFLSAETDAILLAENGQGLSTELNAQPESFPDQLVNGRRDATRKWASADGYTLADGTSFAAPGSADEAGFNEIGWWGNGISNASGVFTPSQRVSITFSNRNLNRIEVVADSRRNEWPVDFDLHFFDASNSFISTVQIRGNTIINRSEFVSVQGVSKITLEILTWSRSGTNCKITEISPIFEQVFESQDIVNFSITEQRETGSDANVPTGGITSNEADIVLINEDRIFDNNNAQSPFFGNVRQNARIFLELGVQISPGIFEYVPVFNGWSGGWEAPESDIEASTLARDRLELLTRSQFESSSVVENESFYQWFERVFNDAGLASTEYNIDSLLQGADYIIPFGWIDRRTHRAALELLTRGSGANVFVDRNGLIQVESIEFIGRNNRIPVKTFTRSDYADKDNQPIYANLANEIVVRTTPRERSSVKLVYETPVDDQQSISANSVQTFTIFYNETPVVDSVPTISPAVAGLSITGSTLYSWGADIQVTSTLGVTQAFRFAINGSTLDPVGGREIVARDETSIQNNGLYSLVYEENQFIQRAGLAELIADILVRSFSDPQRDLTITFEPGGDPSLELNDMIAVTDRYDTANYNIVNTEISYNGGLNIRHEGRIIGFTALPLAAETGAVLLAEDDSPLFAEGDELGQ